MTEYAFQLAFAQITCSGCGVTRIRGVECADCGRRPKPWEIDTSSVARRQAAAQAQTLLLQTVTPPPVRPVGATEFLHAEVFARLDGWTDAFFRAVAAAAKGEGPQGLEAVLAEFIELRDLVHAADVRRPFGVLVNALRELVDELQSMVSAYLAALLASTPLQAERQATLAQQHLDRAAELIGQTGAIAFSVGQLSKERDPAQMQSLLLARALQVYQASDLLALEAAGRDKLQVVTSSRGALGSGLLFATTHVLAQHLFDPVCFCEVLNRCYTVLRSNPAVLERLAATPVFKEDLERAVLELFDGSMEAAHTVDNAVHTRQAGRALLGVAASLVEGPGRIIAAVLLLACGRKSASYANLRHEMGTKLVNTVQEESALQGLLDGLDSDLRTGRAHALAHYEQDAVVIERKSKTRRVAWGDVIDGVFQGFESVLACQLALLQVLGELGDNSFRLKDLWRTLGITDEQMTAAILLTMQYQDIVITANGIRWHIEARGGSDTPLPIVVIMLQPYLPESVNELVFTAHRGNATHVLSGPVAPWRELSKSPADSDVQQITFLRAHLNWIYDGVPWLSTAYVRWWTAVQASHTLNAVPSVAVARLRSLRELARAAEDDTLVWALTGVIRRVRLGADGDAGAELSQLGAWCNPPAAAPEWWQNHISRFL
ncbi:hypothetical protein LIX60_09425 [Streptomyces sp. S07_1.15]|uniref:hypothetical protein n=1 Tax=Streptomyces sp. S07_1.15 TaxID=2873925 RepID=UPI001D139B7B|nr:hypothetical protein [Streptomyces sp. S07_1.15]MCC3651682.1 hypothetical protein [Streptomyces sp. S07_1.15]